MDQSFNDRNFGSVDADDDDFNPRHMTVRDSGDSDDFSMKENFDELTETPLK